MPQATAASPQPERVLDVRDLSVDYALGDRSRVEALTGISLAIYRGETVGILGESGSGKSTLAQAIAGLLHPNGRIRSGWIRLLDGARGRDRDSSINSQSSIPTGNEIALIAQDPM